MKILALRLRNLASLAGEVALDFEAPPLAQAGLFAITGPTGAGKSTLLDALCLALYDRLPRLDHAARTETGGGLVANDVRSILRHGAAAGFAEVDFAGRDGGRYRARWEVRRAYGKTGGKLQRQSLSLTDLAGGMALGGTNTETLEAIRDKVGLDFSQFRRSVLLAQNEFDAFLRAKPAERAELLELMTGTAVYGRLSVAAFERWREERARLEAEEADLARVQVLDDDLRAALAAETAEAAADVERREAELAALTREADWHRTTTALETAVGAAEAGHRAARDARNAARPERDRMARVRMALGVRPLVAEADRLALGRQRLDEEAAEAGREMEARRSAADLAAAARDTARAAEEQGEAALRQAGPSLDRAADLDARIAAGRERLERSRTAAAQARQEAERAAAEHGAAAAAHAACVAAIRRLEAWSEKHAGRKPLAEQLERWLEAIAAHESAERERRAAERAHAAATTDLAGLEAEIGKAAERRQALAAAAEALDAAIATLDRQLATADGDALERRRQDLDTSAAALAALDDTARAAVALAARGDDLERRRLTAQSRRAQAGTQAAAAEERRREVEAALPEARAALALAEAADSEQAAALRRRLVAGEPCPVCGARAHALTAPSSALTGLLAAYGKRVAELEGERDVLLARQAEAAADRRTAEEALALAEADSVALATERADAERRWTAARPAVGLPLPASPFDPVDLPGLAAARADCTARLAELSGRLQAVRSMETERRRRMQEREAGHRDREQVAVRLADLASRQAEAAGRAAQTAADRERAAGDKARLARLLAVPLAVIPDAPVRLAADGSALATTCRTLAAEWRDTLAELDAARRRDTELAAQRDTTALARQHADEQAARQRAACTEEQAGLDALTASRAALFDGRPTAAMRAGFEAAIREAQARHRAAQEAWAAALQARGVAEERRRNLIESLAAIRRDLGSATAARDAALAAVGFDLAAARREMAAGEHWLADADARQTALHEAETTALAVLAERRRSLEAHRSGGMPQRDAASLAELLPQCRAALDEARTGLAALRQRLAEDDRNRDRAGETRDRVARQRQRHDLWKGMADLIGSADGKKFRLFAQGLTLDRLLGLANTHLAELTPRYVLERAPGGDLDLQVVDRDMADEVRGVANLSGGERFLVSLALALGLANMTGRRSLAESLFIDEGFGALDGDSLDVAIGALESLHASGRKVGVISHVQPMIERIGVQIRVTRLGGGRSAVEIRGG